MDILITDFRLPNVKREGRLMQAVILSAGKGSRLNPITLTRTKAMLPILGKPIIERVMETLTRNGIRQFILVINRAGW